MQSRMNANTKMMIYAGVIFAVLLAGLWFIARFAESEVQKDMAGWQTRLNLVADSRAAAASTWLNRHLNTVEELAADASIQLYTEQAMMGGTAEAIDGQRGYIFSLLSAEAERFGFHEKRPIDAVAANVKRPRRAGLSVVAGDGTTLVVTTGMPLLRPEELNFGKDPSFIKIGPALGDKTLLVLFGARIGPAGDKGQSKWVVGARPLDGDFLATLKQPGEQTKTAETYLVAPWESNIVTALTPLMEGGKVGTTRQDPAASFASKQPGGFATLKNYAGTDVLVTGKELTAPVSWILVRTVSAAEATEAITKRKNNLIITMWLGALFVLAALILVWRHGVSKRLEVSYREQEDLSHKNEALSEFLKSVSDGQPTAIAALDGDMTVRFTNRRMTELTGIEEADLQGRRIDTAFSGEGAASIKEAVKNAVAGKNTQLEIIHGEDGKERTFKTDLLPLAAGGDSSAKVLIVMEDISALVAAQERSEALHKQLIGTLTEIIDARDPWSRHHSTRVADVATSIAQEMGWDDDAIESVNTAGHLVNIGKIFVPSAILTKQTPLSDDELTLVRDSIQKGAALIEGVEFKGPVAKTLGQMREHWDGNGDPDGLKEDQIEPGARVLAIANSFVGMISARAHREGLSYDKTASILQGDAGTRFERRPIAALQNVLENKGGRERWQHYMKKTD